MKNRKSGVGTGVDLNHYRGIKQDRTFLDAVMAKVEQDPLLGEKDRWDVHSRLGQMKRTASFPNGEAPKELVRQAVGIVQAKRKASEHEALGQDEFIRANILDNPDLPEKQRLPMARKANRMRQSQGHMGFAEESIDNMILDQVSQTKSSLSSPTARKGQAGQNDWRPRLGAGLLISKGAENGSMPNRKEQGAGQERATGQVGFPQQLPQGLLISDNNSFQSLQHEGKPGQKKTVAAGHFGAARNTVQILPPVQGHDDFNAPASFDRYLIDSDHGSEEEQPVTFVQMRSIVEEEGYGDSSQLPENTLVMLWLNAKEAKVLRRRVVTVATGYESSEKWLADMGGPGTDDDEYYCNIFIYDVMKEAGLYVPTPNGRLGMSPPIAQQWASTDPNSIQCWFIVDNPQPGDVVARQNDVMPGQDPTFHVGIVVEGDQSISSAYDGRIRVTKFGFRPHEQDTVVFRRYNPACGHEHVQRYHTMRQRHLPSLRYFPRHRN